ncbi:MAG: matrixin family metalloprotease [Elusimicrobiales bacterium]|nr:matrixin family metalloprotease [Elusimicrobiales bacterium]
MRKLILWFILLLLLGVAAFQWHTHKALYRSAARITLQRTFPCSKPVTYAIGAIDPAFNVSPEEFRDYLKDAEAVWEAAAGRDLFALVPGGADLTVNMVYDKRQAALDKLKGLGLLTDQSLAAYKLLKERYDGLIAELDPRQAALAARLADYKKGEAEYNGIVAVYNQRGAATRRQLEKLQRAKGLLEREFAAIKRLEREVNSDIDLLNALATTLNQLIVELSLNAEQYKREGSALGVYEEGLYIVEGGLRRIDIFKNAGRAQLTRLLAHELGHALNIDHVPGPESLMYPMNRGVVLALFPDDLAALDQACASPVKRTLREKLGGIFSKK